MVNQFVNDFVAKRGIITSITVVHFRVPGAFPAISVSAGCRRWTTGCAPRPRWSTAAPAPCATLFRQIGGFRRRGRSSGWRGFVDFMSGRNFDPFCGPPSWSGFAFAFFCISFHGNKNVLLFFSFSFFSRSMRRKKLKKEKIDKHREGAEKIKMSTAQCWNLKNFLSLRFYVKWVLARLFVAYKS